MTPPLVLITDLEIATCALPVNMKGFLDINMGGVQLPATAGQVEVDFRFYQMIYRSTISGDCWQLSVAGWPEQKDHRVRNQEWPPKRQGDPGSTRSPRGSEICFKPTLVGAIRPRAGYEAVLMGAAP